MQLNYPYAYTQFGRDCLVQKKSQDALIALTTASDLGEVDASKILGCISLEPTFQQQYIERAANQGDIECIEWMIATCLNHKKFVYSSILANTGNIDGKDTPSDMLFLWHWS